MPQLSGRKRSFPRREKTTIRPNKRFKKEYTKNNRSSNAGFDLREAEQQRLRAKHPFRSFETNPKPKIKLDKSSNNTTPKYVKPKGPLSKKDLRERKRDRKAKKSHGKLRSELNYLASSTSDKHQKISKMSRKNQHEFVEQLVNKMKGNILNIIKKLDSTRAIQMAIKYGSQPQILCITQELKGHFLNLCCEHYSHKTVRALLEYGRDKVRDIILSELMKAITRLILHRLASNVVDYAIMVIANEDIRRKAFQYFISPKFIIMTQYEETAVDSDKSDIKTPKTISDIMSNAPMMERNQIVKNMEKFLISGFEKEIVSTGIFQTILYHYIYNIYDEKKKMWEIIELIAPCIMQIQNVKEGVMAVVLVLNYSINLKPKLRKTLIKNMSDYVITMCCDKHSYLIIIKLLDVIDDTVLLNKVMIKQMMDHLHILMYHDFGRLVLLHLLSARNDMYFKRNKLYNLLCKTPVTQSQKTDKEVLSFVEEDDDEDVDVDAYIEPLSQANCRKHYEIKRIELLKKVLPQMIGYCNDNIKKLLCHDIAGGVVIEIVRCVLYDEKAKRLKCVVKCRETLLKCIVDASVVDISAREISPEPLEPETPIVPDAVEVTNIVDDSLNIVDSQSYAQAQSNLSTVDITKMDPATAKSIRKLQEQQNMKKNNEVYMKLNAKYEIKMIEYQLSMIRHKNKIKREDMNKGIMEHGLGHRRLRKMMEQFDDTFYKYFMDVLQDESVINEEKWIHLLSVKGVYVIWELYNGSNQQNKDKLKQILKPICGKMSKIIKEESNQQGLKKLCNALGVDL